MALAVNGKYFHAQITVADIVAEAVSWGLKESRKIVNDTLEIVRSVAVTQKPDSRAYRDLDTDIGRSTQNLLDGKPTLGA